MEVSSLNDDNAFRQVTLLNGLVVGGEAGIALGCSSDWFHVTVWRLARRYFKKTHNIVPHFPNTSSQCGRASDTF